MAKTRSTKPTPLDDAIRIVPLHAVAFAERLAAPAPKLTYRKGPLLGAVEVFTIFWGDGWKAKPQSGLIPELNAFFDFVLTSTLMDQLAEYNAGGVKIGHGRRTGSAAVPGKLAASVTDAAVQTFVTQQITAKKAPKATGNTLYFIYLPPGVRVVMGGASSCTAFCGYHSAIGTSTFYAVMPYPGCSGCLGGLSVLDSLTSTSSHELCEAITDPVPGQGWYDDVNGEIGDICAWQTKKLGAYTVQLEWSNKAATCV
jgi:hypothetical protein